MKTLQGLNKNSKIERMNFFSSLFQNSPIPKTISSLTTKNYVFVNPAWEQLTGFSKKEAIGKTAFDLNLITIESGALIREKLLQEKEIISYECSIRLKNGTEIKILMAFDVISINGEEFVLNTINNLDDLHKYKEQHEKVLIKRTEELLLAKDFIIDSIENMTDGFVSLNNDWIYTYVNKKAGKILGKTPADLIGKHIWTEFPEGVGQPFYHNYYKAVETQQAVSFEEYYQPWHRWFENRVIPSNTGISVFFQDITERKKAEELLIKSEKSLNDFINNIGDPLFIKDSQSRLLLVNDVFCKIFNLSKTDIIGKTLAEDVTPEEREEFLRIDKQVLTTGVENINEESLTVRGEKTRIISTKKNRFIDDSDKKYIIGIIRDITERKQSEIKLQENEKSLLEAQRIAKIGSYNLNLKTQIAETSITFNEIVGLDLNSELTFDVWGTITHPEDALNNQKVFDKCVKTGRGFDLEYRILTKNKKELKWIHGLGKVIYIDGEAVNFFGTIQDITERKQVQIELNSAKEFSDKLIMSMQEGLIIVNLEGEILMVNDSTCKILGYSKDELQGLNLPYPFAKLEDFEEIGNTNKKIAQEEIPPFQFEFIKKSGEKFLASFSTGNIKNDKGEVIALFGTMKDISEEHKVKKTLEDIAIKSALKKDVILKLASLVGKDFISSLKNITKEASEILNVERVSVWSFNFDKTEIYCEKLYTLNSKSYTNGFIIKNIDNPEYFKALEENQTILVSDAHKNSITKKFVKHYLIPNNIKSLMDVFIHSTNGYYGIICFEHVGKTNRNWTADEQEFATSIANIVSIMVESNERKVAENKIAKANEQLKEANKELNTLRNQLEQENVYLRNELDLVFNYEEMVYGSAAFSDVLTEVEKVAPTNATVLLLGESGTGKELLARAIHNIGLRSSKPLIKVNCSAIPRELIESELFGHKKGSFTGAFNDKVGKFELADGGTLFLDEIGELPLDMQPKILRFLQEGEIEVVGGTRLKKLDVRIIAATNKNLKEEIEKKQFREDLYFRLHVFPIEIPPLRKRKEDIPLLVEHFVDKFNKSYLKNIKYISDDSMNQLKAYDWPGNIRELENLIERAAILSTSETLLIPGFESETQKSKIPINNKNLSLDLAQRNHILQVLEQCNWKISGPNGAAVLLDLKPSTLRDKMSKLDLSKALKK